MITSSNSVVTGTSLVENTVPKRLLLGPGPSELDPDVARAMLQPQLGHMDPAMFDILSRMQNLLRDTFRTDNRLTIALSGTGTSGMQASLFNTVGQGDSVVVGVIGYFGDRLASMAKRLGARVTHVNSPWGKPLDLNDLSDAIKRSQPRAVAVVHGETSTGVVQNHMDQIADMAHAVGALLVVDTVASLGGHPIEVDGTGIDVCYSGSQKALGAPSGLAPITFSERAMERLRERATPVPSYYLDVLELEKYWMEHQYHHTISAPLYYALCAALEKLHDEGLTERWNRHRRNYAAFAAGIEALGLEILARPADRLRTVAGVLVPDGLNAAAIQQELLAEHNIEVAGGLGPFKGKMLRVGLMGYGSHRQFVLQLLAALETVLRQQGQTIPSGAGLSAAMAAYKAESRERA